MCVCVYCRISTNSSFTVEEIANFLTSRFSVDGLVMYCNKGFDFSNSNPGNFLFCVLLEYGYIVLYVYTP